jgi:hypothetical protein
VCSRVHSAVCDLRLLKSDACGKVGDAGADREGGGERGIQEKERGKVIFFYPKKKRFRFMLCHVIVVCFCVCVCVCVCMREREREREA